MTTMEDAMSAMAEGFRLVRASERLGALIRPMEAQLEMIDEIIEVAPELGPEMSALCARLSESLDHLTAAAVVLDEKVKLI
jgi:hypothetical protein